jgi:hypothetical protein
MFIISCPDSKRIASKKGRFDRVKCAFQANKIQQQIFSKDYVSSATELEALVEAGTMQGARLVAERALKLHRALVHMRRLSI